MNITYNNVEVTLEPTARKYDDKSTSLEWIARKEKAVTKTKEMNKDISL